MNKYLCSDLRCVACNGKPLLGKYANVRLEVPPFYGCGVQNISGYLISKIIFRTPFSLFVYLLLVKNKCLPQIPDPNGDVAGHASALNLTAPGSQDD